MNGIDISDMKLKDMIQAKEWKDVIKKIEVIISEMNPDMLSYCQDKISNIYDKYLNIEGEPNYEEASWMLPTDQQDETGKQGMGRSDSIWNEMNVIGVTEGIYNDTVAISKESQYYTPEIVAALQDCFINIIGTDEGKAIFDVYSHTGYAKATDADYDGARARWQRGCLPRVVCRSPKV